MYIDFDPKIVWDRMLAIYYENGGDVLSDGDEKNILLKSVLAMLTHEAWNSELVARRQTLRYADGEYLDILGENRGVIRKEAKKARVKAKITIIKGTMNLIQKGVVFRGNENNIYYQTMNDIAIYNTDSANAILECTVAGADGNKEKAGNIIQPIYQGNVLYAELLEDAKGGMEAETDENYRERIKYSMYENNKMGTKIAYETNTKAIDSSIIDANAIRMEDGSVKVYVIIDEKADKAAIIKKAQESLNKKERIPLSDNVIVEQGVQKKYNLKIKYKAKVGTAATIISAIDEFKNQIENDLGAVFDVFMLLSLLYKAGASEVDIDTANSDIAGSKEIYKKHESGENGYWKGEIELNENV